MFQLLVFFFCFFFFLLCQDLNKIGYFNSQGNLNTIVDRIIVALGTHIKSKTEKAKIFDEMLQYIDTFESYYQLSVNSHIAHVFFQYDGGIDLLYCLGLHTWIIYLVIH